MPNVPLSAATLRRLDALFAEADRAAAAELLVTRCGDELPFNEASDPVQLERIRFAALKLSAGDLARLRETVARASVDSRDVLMDAGFGADVMAHKTWQP